MCLTSCAHLQPSLGPGSIRNNTGRSSSPGPGARGREVEKEDVSPPMSGGMYLVPYPGDKEDLQEALGGRDKVQSLGTGLCGCIWGFYSVDGLGGRMMMARSSHSLHERSPNYAP